MHRKSFQASGLLLALVSALAGAQTRPVFQEAMMTAAELSNFQRTSTFAEVVSVIDALDAETELMHRETLLVTAEGREVPVVVLADPPVTSPQQARDSGKPVIYLQGNIHGGEVEGKEASLILMRDLLFGDKQHLLDNQILVLVPIYNADGNDAMTEDSRPNQELSPVLAGQRTAHGYDLNRDGIALEAMESAALMERVILRWDPDLLVDLHTTNGTWHGNSLTYAPSYQTAGDAATSNYTAEVMLPTLKRRIKDQFNLDFDWYGGYDYRDWPPTELRTYHHAPRYLTNQMGLRNRMAILSETFSHDRFYKRVHAANVFIEEILEYTALHGQRIRQINRQADARVAASGYGYEQGVRFEMVPRAEPLDLLTYQYIPYRRADGSVDYVRSAELMVIPGVANYNAFAPIETALKPRGYVFASEFANIADKLRQHGIPVQTLNAAESFSGQVFSVSGIGKTAFPLNDHRNSVLEGEFRNANRRYGAGSFFVPMDHRLANLAFYLLEPRADDGLAFWNFFDAYLEAALVGGDAVDYPVFKILE